MGLCPSLWWSQDKQWEGSQEKEVSGRTAQERVHYQGKTDISSLPKADTTLLDMELTCWFEALVYKRPTAFLAQDWSWCQVAQSDNTTSSWFDRVDVICLTGLFSSMIIIFLHQFMSMRIEDSPRLMSYKSWYHLFFYQILRQLGTKSSFMEFMHQVESFENTSGFWIILIMNWSICFQSN